jgi:fructokinase
MTKFPIAIFGEVLFDQFPDGGQVLGGAPFNVAWHLQAFGQAPCFISRVGTDLAGGKVRSAMHHWGMATDCLQTDPKYPTGTVSITFHDGEPAYQILDQQAYDYVTDSNPPTPAFGVVYHGTLALRHSSSAETLAAILARHTGKVFVDVNLRPPWWQAEQVKTVLARADWVKLNEAELWQLSGQRMALKDAMQSYIDAYGLTVIVVTRGANGAVALAADGEWVEVSPSLATDKVVDTVGAGDAFASVLLLGLQLDWPLALAMERAQAFASALVGVKGATVQDFGFYSPFSEAWNLPLIPPIKPLIVG